MLLNVTIYAGILASLQQFYNSENIYVIYTHEFKNTTSYYNLSRLYREIQYKRNIMISTLLVSQLPEVYEGSKSFVEDGRPLVTFMVDNVASIKEYIAQVIIKRTMSSAKWVLFINEDESIEYIFKDIYIPFFCEFLLVNRNGSGNRFVINEAYQVAPKYPLQIKYFGKWDEKFGLTTNYSVALYKRRKNLQGVSLDVTTAASYPIIELNDDSYPTNMTGGYFGEVWLALESALNFTSNYTVLKRNMNSFTKQKSNWNGMVNFIMQGNASVAVADFLMTSGRQKVVNYATPLLFTRYNLVIRQPDNRMVRWYGFLAPFKPDVWICLFILISVIPFFLILMIHISRSYQNPVYEWEERRKMDVFMDVFKTICSQGLDFQPRFTPCRIIYAMLYAMAVVLLASYSAALISFLTVQTFSLPFTSLEGFIKDGTYRLGVPPDSAEWNLFSNSTNKLLLKINERYMDPPEKQLGYTEGLLKTCTNSKYGYFLTKAHGEAYQKDLPCTLENVDSDMWASLSFIMSKNCPYRGLFNYNIQLLRDGGILKRLRGKAWPRSMDKVKPTWESMTMEGTLPILAFLSVITFVSICLLGLEYYVRR